MNDAPLNRSEAFVSEICQRSFLSLWCYNNPRGKSDKELCDVLVVCDPDVIIVSVKEILLNQQTDPVVAHARWERKAVDASVSQIYGAERWLASATQVVRRDGSPGLRLPAPAGRRTHRLAVALGDGGQAVTKSEDFSNGFVHVLTEQSFREVMGELDTITDFTEYLVARELFARSGTMIVCEGPESNLLGWYLSRERTFPSGQNLAIFDQTIWPGLQNDPAFRRRKEAERASYGWDRLTEGLADPDARSVSGPEPELNDLELALRVMARESRFNRRSLATFAGDFVSDARAGKTRARILRGPSGVVYVFVYFSPTETADWRRAELTARCYVARGVTGHGDVIVGIGLSNLVLGVGSASDLAYLHFPIWTGANQAEAAKLQKDSGFFSGAIIEHRSADEYPKGP